MLTSTSAGESGSNGSTCSDCRKIKVPEVQMTPSIPGQENVTHIPSAIERELEGRMGGGVVDTKEMTEQVKQERQQKLMQLMQMDFPPKKAYYALKRAKYDLNCAVTALTNDGAGAEGGAAAEEAPKKGLFKRLFS